MKPAAVSIPRSGFCGVGPPMPRASQKCLPGCFNPSVGILWGGTPTGRVVAAVLRRVSIPRSGFCGVGR